ncbi:RrF2 family transcriptional regulator [Paenibacillus marinisediminis]
MNTKSKALCIGPPRFAIAVHALVWLTQSECKCSSAAIAEQVKSHAAFLRRVLAQLANAGIVDAKEGRDGGYTLKIAPDQIKLADVYLAMKNDCAESAVEVDCGEAGKQLDLVLDKIMLEAERQTIEYLRQFSIADLMGAEDSV